MERAAQALAPREHENYLLFFRVFILSCFRDKFILFGLGLSELGVEALQLFIRRMPGKILDCAHHGFIGLGHEFHLAVGLHPPADLHIIPDYE
jgi:hypothetical protein